MTKRATQEDCQNWLNEISNNKYEILFWPQVGKDVCEILDKERNFVIKCTWTYVRDRLRINKNTIFFPSEEEKKEVYIKQKETLQKRDAADSGRKKLRYQKAKETKLQKAKTDPDYQKKINEKILKTILQKNNGIHHLHKPEIREKVLVNAFSEEANKKRQATIEAKYGAKNISYNEDVKKKRLETKIKNGHIHVINGQTLEEIAIEKDVAYTTIQSLYLKTKDEDLIKNYEKGRTGIEQIIYDILTKHSVSFTYDKSLKLNEQEYCQPDFIIEDKKLIIECDGLMWHSDKINKDNKYHIKKQKQYSNLGYESLFFREDEILNKPKIIESMILNKMGLNKSKIPARKCKIKEITDAKLKRDFFEANHLMGAGVGRCFALYYKEDIVAAIQIKNKKDKNGGAYHDISRICSKLNHTIQGGVARLIKHAINELRIQKLTTFIDRRYGNGNYLHQLGFVASKYYPSFRWTNFKQTVYRQNPGFEGNKGYEKGFYKIWDCGQVRWDLILNKSGIK